MRKTFALLLAAAFVAAIPAAASAKSTKRQKHRQVAALQSEAPAGPRFVGNALYQILVPWEQTFGPRR